MDKEELNRYKNILIKEKQKTMSLVKNLQEEDILSKDKQGSDLSSYDNHPSDSASELFEMEKNLALEENEKIMINKINTALKSIEKGTYGKCKMCGKDISKDRLNVVPYAEYCISCQNQISSYENGEKRPIEEKNLDYTFGYESKSNNIGYDRVDAYRDVGIFNMIHNVEEYDDYDIEDKEGFVEPVEMISNAQYKSQLPD